MFHFTNIENKQMSSVGVCTMMFSFLLENKNNLFSVFNKEKCKTNFFFTIIAKIKVPRLLFFMRCQLIDLRKLSLM